MVVVGWCKDAACTAGLCFFFNDTATTEIYTLSLHDALPIWARIVAYRWDLDGNGSFETSTGSRAHVRRVIAKARSEEPRLNSSHGYISYAVFCLKKKKKTTIRERS